MAFGSGVTKQTEGAARMTMCFLVYVYSLIVRFLIRRIWLQCLEWTQMLHIPQCLSKTIHTRATCASLTHTDRGVNMIHDNRLPSKQFNKTSAEYVCATHRPLSTQRPHSSCAITEFAFVRGDAKAECGSRVSTEHTHTCDEATLSP